jgi:hypothetical protein
MYGISHVFFDCRLYRQIVVVPIIISIEIESKNIIKLIDEIKDIVMQNVFNGSALKVKVITNSSPMIGINLSMTLRCLFLLMIFL